MKNSLPCTSPGCDRTVKVFSYELCGRCYQRERKSGNLPEKGSCSEAGCSKSVVFRGLCRTHRSEQFPDLFPLKGSRGKYLNPDGTRISCIVEGCEGVSVSNQMCRRCDSRRQRFEERGYEWGFVNIGPDGVRLTCKSSLDPCEKPARVKGYCRLHWDRIRRSGSEALSTYGTCPVAGCGRDKLHASKICKRCNQLRWRYSLTVERVIELHLPDNRYCWNEGCQSREDLHLDHAHTCCPDGKFGTTHKKSCGKCVRGWLCRDCNWSLGRLQENPRMIQGLLDYLERGGGRA